MAETTTPQHIDGLDLLREEIVLFAVNDLRGVLAGRKMPFPCSADELHRFFHGEWAQLLLGTIDGAALYERLVKEAEEMKAAAHGLAYGTTMTGVISGDGAYDVAIASGAYVPLKPVVGFEHYEFANTPSLRRAVTRDIMQKISGAYALDA